MNIKRFTLGKLLNNTYIVSDRKTNECMVIDPTVDTLVYVNYIRENDLDLKYIVLTHNHHDHIGGVKIIKEHFADCDICIHKNDYKGLLDPKLNYSEDIKIKADVILKTNQYLTLGSLNFKVLNTKGHTKGSISLYEENKKVIFTGDALFIDDIGRWDLASGSKNDSIETMKNIFDKLEDDIKVYPGHENIGTMKDVRIQNEWFLKIINDEV
ncbi:MAG: MBL fold metallo-hydrolase [Peptostreptococcaceae bacterium]|jgi:glyoxylase-like metal-dependent hydrolase (beta-lactamase superfamily II)|nr:MBL fold metallo-hydrolase [Peptostreptococcaceae bacterium]